MEILIGALLNVWIVLCILTAIFLTVGALSCLICAVSPPDDSVDIAEAFIGFVICSFIAGLLYIHIWYLPTKPQKTPETPATRDIILTVPESSRVDAQVTSENNTINLQNL